MTTTVLIEDIPISKIEFSPGNPRTDAMDDLEGMAASMGDETNPMLVNPPIVKKIKSERSSYCFSLSLLTSYFFSSQAARAPGL